MLLQAEEQHIPRHMCKCEEFREAAEPARGGKGQKGARLRRT